MARPPPPPPPSDPILDELRAAGALALCVPRAWGGGGAGLDETLCLLAETGARDGSAGLVLAMHLSQALTLARHAAGQPALEAALEALCAGGGLIASATSEKTSGGDIFATGCFYDPGAAGADGRLRFVKHSPNISYADRADAFLVTVMERRAPRPRQRLLLARRGDLDLRCDRVNRLMGMQGMLNAAWTLRVDAPRDQLFAAPYPLIARASMTPATHLFWAATWCGMAGGLLAKARDFVKRELAQASPEQAEMQALNSRLRDRLGIMQALLRDAARAWQAACPEAPDFALAAQLNRVKTECSELLVHIATDVLKILGLRGYALEGPYSVATEIADALAAPLLVSNARLRRNSTLVDHLVPLAL